MLSWLPDAVIAVLILGLTYALASEGLWGAALMFFNVVFAGMIAFNFYEPLAALIDTTGVNWGMSDTICLIVLFSVSVLILRLTTERLAPTMVRFPTPVYHVGRLVFGLATSVVTIAILTLAFECAPVHKKFLNYKQQPPFGLGIDHHWLAFFQYSTGYIFADYHNPERDWLGEYGTAKVFDPKAEWLIEHQNKRPYGEPSDTVLGEEGGAARTGGAGGAAPPASAPWLPGMAPRVPGGPPRMPPSAPGAPPSRARAWK
jgi:uncharacterized membrane protein required for colicin V production